MGAWLTPSGTMAAALVGGTVLAGAGWRGLLLLVLFLASSSLLTKGGGRRRAEQVLANGGAAAACAVLMRWHWTFTPAFAGALAAAAADTWSTEIGRRSKTAPRLITTGRTVAPGTSGGLTVFGSAGGVAGAALIAATAHALGLVSTWNTPWIALAGTLGGIVDSLLGALLQARYRCGTCGTIGETRRCSCGGTAFLAGGMSWMTNDTVNFCCTLVGAITAYGQWAMGGGR